MTKTSADAAAGRATPVRLLLVVAVVAVVAVVGVAACGGAAGTPPDGPSGDAPGADAGSSADAPSTPGDAAVQPVDCAPIASAHQLCSSSADRCEAVFTGGEGCAAVCALAGLACRESYEDVAGACAADTALPALGCANTGHTSDYCVCGRAGACTPSCTGRICGDDGCGGSCGACDDGERCEGGACVPEIVDCSQYPLPASALLAELVGFGQHTTGGDPANVYRVTNDNASGAGSLRAGLESDQDYWIVFDIGVGSEAVIDLGTTPIRVRSHKTVDGRLRRVLVNGALDIRDARNIILNDLRLMNDNFTACTQEGDVVSLHSAGGATPADFPTRDIWLHHLELFQGGDGLFDVRGGSRITVSWSHFHTHAKGMLVGMESAPALEGSEMEITFHHNFLDRLSRRGPQVSVGRAHFFNNYQFEWWEFGAASLAGAEFLSEGNVYQARPGATCGLPFVGCQDPNPCGDSDYQVSKVALSFDWATDNHGFVRSTGDLTLEDATIAVREPASVFTPTYPYQLEPATTALAAEVKTRAGPRTTCP
jgi:pectate lyase